MDENLLYLDSISVDDSDDGSQSEISPSRPSGSNLTGIKLVLPSLKSLKQANAKKKGKSSKTKKPFTGYDDTVKRPQRPAKLKPLKEVLSRLVTQLQKKDDYAFFLNPVDPSKIPGYSNVVKRPMDLGTMGTKVQRGRYRSLEDFANDFRLVTSNAMAFNPPDSIYYVEAERLQAWGEDHISKAAATVIQYETDWNIDIEQDEGDLPPIVEDSELMRGATPVETAPPETREASVFSQQEFGRRTTRAALKPKTATEAGPVSETIDAEGRLPGSREGIGAFPAMSPWAQTMLRLKLKGKRYKTKKERMRIEKEGPPYAADGSLDYNQIEEPFSILSALVPDTFGRPQLTPVYQSTPSQPSISTGDRQFLSQTPAPSSPFPSPVHVPVNSVALKPPEHQFAGRRSHWTVLRNVSSRTKAKERDEDVYNADWMVPRQPHAADFGSFALLAAELAAEMSRRGLSGQIEDEQRVLESIRESVEVGASDVVPKPTEYWNRQRSLEADDYIRDVVYGGPDGFAYIQSLARFVPPSSKAPSSSALGMPLHRWVEINVVDPLTEGRHRLLGEAANLVRDLPTMSVERARASTSTSTVAQQVLRSLVLYPQTTNKIADLLKLNAQKIDMGPLIYTPTELILSEEFWLKQQRETDVVVNGSGADSEQDINVILNRVAVNLRILSQQLATPAKSAQDVVMSNTVEEKAAPAEPETQRNLRLTLLALAKRAPLDAIIGLPRELVPEHYRHYLPPTPIITAR